MIQVSNLKKQYGQRTLFENVTFNVSPRERIGLVGRNGTGKSTLFKIIQGLEDASGGEVVIPKGYRLGVLAQHLKFTEKNIVDECATALPKELEYEVYRAEKILSGLGFSTDDFSRSPYDFSGGQQIRLNLAKMLLSEPQMLLLDEPTNYLDIVSMRWLRNVLKSFPGEVILITHDRDFMDDVVTHIMGIHRGELKKIPGNTEKFYQQLYQAEEIYEQTRQNLEKKKKEIQVFIDRFKAKASKATQAQSKMKLLEKMGDMEELDDLAQMHLRFQYKECPGKYPLTVENLSFGYEDGPDLFSDLSFSLKKQERVAIIGKNGRGKSTLLNVLGGELTPRTGKMTWHPSSRIGHFGQTNVLRLHLENTIEQEVQASNPDISISHVRAICGSMLFSGDDAKKKIKVLSGGERARVLLGKILACPSNVLLLDEPTNHLDMESIEILMDELTEYPGAVILVTHSERLLKHLAQNLIVFLGGKAEYFHGGYQDFLDRIGWQQEEEDGESEVPVKKKISRKEHKRRRQEIIQERSQVLNPLKNEIEILEKKVISLEERKEVLSKKLIQLSQQTSGGKEAQEISQELGELGQELEIFYEDFEKKTTEFEQKTGEFEADLESLDKLL